MHLKKYMGLQRKSFYEKEDIKIFLKQMCDYGNKCVCLLTHQDTFCSMSDS